MITATTEIKLEAQEAVRTEISCASEVSIVGLGKFGLGITRKRAAQLASEFAAVHQRMQTADA
jgi:hypothetical protein